MIRSLIFFSLLGAMVLGNLAWWRSVHLRAKRLKYGLAIRVIAGLWAGTMFAMIAGIIGSRIAQIDFLAFMPRGILAAVYIWHFLFVLGWVVWRLLRNGAVGIRKLAVASRRADEVRDNRPAVEETPLASRRQFLAGAAMMAPPAIATLAAWHGVTHLDEFRINYQTLRIPNLPGNLEGVKIAHVSDIHIGKFTDEKLLRKITDQTNLLKPDLVLMTGDLLDFNLADLPGGLDLIHRFQPRFGLAMCEGNHDLFQGRHEFEQRVRYAGVQMPINGSTQVTVRGQEVQILSLRWGGPDVMDKTVNSSDQLIEESMKVLTKQVNPWAFPILLAHHPHAFDYLGNAPMALTLAGHTHGGQINPAPWLRPASLRFRYLSGLYENAGRHLFVSNGVGNWFPLRVNAPAEIVQITLTRA